MHRKFALLYALPSRMLTIQNPRQSNKAMWIISGPTVFRGQLNFLHKAVLQTSFPSPSYALVNKAVPDNFLRPIDITQIDQNRLCHDGLQPIKIESAELLPFGDDHQHRSTLGATIGIVAKCNIAYDTLGLLHSDRVIDTHLGTHVLQRSDKRNRRRLTHVVSVRLECEAQNRDGFSAQLAAKGHRYLARHRALARIIDSRHRLDDPQRRGMVLRGLDQRDRILRKA